MFASRTSVVTALLATTVGLLPVFLLGSLAVLVQRDIPFTAIELGTAVALSFVASTIMAIPAGRIVDRVGPGRTVRLASVVGATALVGLGFMSQSWAMVMGFVVLGGIGHSLAQNGANAVLFAGRERRQLALAFGIKESAIPIASLVSGLTLPLIGLTMGWRWVFIFATLLALLLFLLSSQPARGPRVRREGDVSIRAGRRPVFIIAVAGGLGSAALTAMVTFLVVWLVRAGFEASAAGFLLGFGSIIAVGTRLVAGWMGYRRGVEPLRAASVLMGLGAIGFALLGAGGDQLLTITGTLLAFLGGWGWTGSLLAGIAQSVANAPVTALPILQMGFSAGGVLGPIAFSAIVQFVSYAAAWGVLAAAALLSAGLIFIGHRMLTQAPPGQHLTR